MHAYLASFIPSVTVLRKRNSIGSGKLLGVGVMNLETPCSYHPSRTSKQLISSIKILLLQNLGIQDWLLRR